MATTKTPNLIRYRVKLNDWSAANGKFPEKLDALVEAKALPKSHSFKNRRELETELWKQWIEQLIKDLEGDPVFAEYSVRERFLALFYTLSASLDEFDALGHHAGEHIWSPAFPPGFLNEAGKLFQAFCDALLADGLADGEVKDRWVINKKYPEWLWSQALYIIQFWHSDTSEQKSRTDVLIEKSVNAFFDLVGALAVDSVADLLRFLLQPAK